MSAFNPYKVLGLSEMANEDEIKNAYKYLALKWHPDRHLRDKEKASIMFTQISNAYQTLMLNGRLRDNLKPAIPQSPPPSSSTSVTYDAPRGPAFIPPPTALPSSSHVPMPHNTYNHHRHESDRIKAPRHNGTKPPLPKPTPPRTQKNKKPVARAGVVNLSPSSYGLPLKYLGFGDSEESIYLLPLGLDELFSGKHCSFGIVRILQSGRSKNVIIGLDIPPGCRAGAKILCHGVGHERQDGTLQDIAFVVEEIIHEKFIRKGDDLIVDLKFPWDHGLRFQQRHFPIQGIDGQTHLVNLDFRKGRAVSGRHIIYGAGMPKRQGGGVTGRGNLIVQLEILPPPPNVFYYMKLFFPFKW